LRNKVLVLDDWVELEVVVVVGDARRLAIALSSAVTVVMVVVVLRVRTVVVVVVVRVVVVAKLGSVIVSRARKPNRSPIISGGGSVDGPTSVAAGSTGVTGAAGSTWPRNSVGSEGTCALACTVRFSGSPGPALLALHEHIRIPRARNDR
jgi:hypothetical protein